MQQLASITNLVVLTTQASIFSSLLTSDSYYSRNGFCIIVIVNRRKCSKLVFARESWKSPSL